MPKDTKMKRINLYISHVQDDLLRELARRTTLSQAELIRRAIDDYVVKEYKKVTSTQRPPAQVRVSGFDGS